MVKLYYDPEGLRVFSDTSAMPSSMKSETESGTNTDQTELISNLKKRIQELEAKLAVSKPTEVSECVIVYIYTTCIIYMCNIYIYHGSDVYMRYIKLPMRKF